MDQQPFTRRYRGDATLDRNPDRGYDPPELRTEAALPRHEREAWSRERRTIVIRAKNGYNDTVSHLLLVDSLLVLRPGQMIRANGLRDILNVDCPQLIWDATTVGRILGEIADLAKEANPKHPPVTRDRDRFGHYFRIETTRQAYDWLHELRRHLRERAAEEIKFQDRGLPLPARNVSVYADMASPSTPAPAAIRPAEPVSLSAAA